MLVNMTSATDEDLAPDTALDPVTPLLTRKVIEEEIYTVKRTTTISRYAETVSPGTPTRRRASLGCSSPPSTPSKHGQRTAAALATPLSNGFYATPGTQGTPQSPGTGNKSKYSRTPSPEATQRTPFSTPQINHFTLAPFTQANRVITSPMPRHMLTPPTPSSTRLPPPHPPIHQPLKYYYMPHPTELESFTSKYFYVVTVGQDVGIFATWYAKSTFLQCCD